MSRLASTSFSPNPPQVVTSNGNGSGGDYSSRAFYELPQYEKYEPADWQTEDLDYLQNRSWSGNWSEMGCFKTSTALWLMEKRLENVENPRVLIITTKRGKGSYFSDIPHCIDVVSK